jgi:hypothetical protein
MMNTDELFTAIARKHLDSLDFHDVALWGVKDALQAAYDAGAASASVRATKMLDMLNECEFYLSVNAVPSSAAEKLLPKVRAAIAEAKPQTGGRRPL